MAKHKQINIITKQIEPLLIDNWANDHIGKIEEMQNDIHKLRELLLFLTSVLIYKEVISINTFDHYEDSWKINKEIR